MRAFFFSDASRRLFGVHHPPLTKVRNAQAILLCYPGLHEYNTAHWAFRRLAGMLSRQGHHVLRFDYFGTGDSTGAVTETYPSVWVENVKEAAAELLDLSAARSVSLVGLRLGATIALQACRTGLKARSLVLWEPVTCGTAYLAELTALDRVRNTHLLHWLRTRRPRAELLGYPLPPDLARALGDVDGVQGPPPRVDGVTIIANTETARSRELASSLAAQGVKMRFESVAGAAAEKGDGKALLSNEALATITQQWAEAPKP